MAHSLSVVGVAGILEPKNPQNINFTAEIGNDVGRNEGTENSKQRVESSRGSGVKVQLVAVIR